MPLYEIGPRVKNSRTHDINIKKMLSTDDYIFLQNTNCQYISYNKTIALNIYNMRGQAAKSSAIGVIAREAPPDSEGS